MKLENYTRRITSLTNFDTFEKPPGECKEVSRLTVCHREMQKKTCIKTKTSQFNNKRFFFL